MADIRSLISQIPMEPGYVPAPPEPDLSVIQRLMGLPQTLRAVGQNLAVGAASLPVGIYQGFGDPAAGEAAMSQFQQQYGYTPTNPAAQRQLQGLGEFLQQLETEYKIPPIMAPVAATPALGIRGLTPQTERLARDLVREIQTTPPTGAVTMAPTPSVPKSDLGFYSQLEAAVQPLQNKGTGQQYLAQIQKSAGVKPEEIQWTGLDTFLQGMQSVTKQEIQDYLNASRVDVQEVRLSDQIDPEDVRAYMEDEAGYGLTYEEALDDLRTGEPSTRFSSYTLPGGENYREILLTLPQKGGVDVKAAEQTRDTLARQTADLMEEWKSLSEEMPGDPRVVELYGRLSETRRARDQAVVDARELRKSAESQTYRSTHFDQPNILAHLRVNDRTVDGKKTLFVEEIQSDWHQAGRKKGYANKENLENWYNQNKLEDDPPFADLSNEQLRVIEANRSAGMGGSSLVPDAPFKTSWHELSLKRAIQEAAEKGYDQIAFTTGKTQAERYDLSKQVDAINYQKHKDGTFSLGVKGKNQVTFENNIGGTNLQNIPAEELSSVVGKDLAEKMIAGEGRRVGQTPTRVFEGLDLSVGGKGMEGFYDNILPKSLDKLGKKFGAKVGKTFIEGERTRDADGFPSMYPEKIEVWQMDITPQMRESVTTKGQPLFAIPAIGAGLLGAGMMQEEEQF